jgi:arginyl-tRNA synthetase
VLNQWGGDVTKLATVDLNTLNTEHELALLQRLADYPEVITNAALDLAPHALANYLKDLAADLHSYYNAQQFLVDDETIKLARLALVAATRQVLSSGLKLLGINAPEKM